MIAVTRHLLGGLLSASGPRKDLVLENLALRQQLLALHEKATTSPTLNRPQMFLDSAAERVVGVAEALGAGDTQNGGRLASCWFQPVLEMALQNHEGGGP